MKIKYILVFFVLTMPAFLFAEFTRSIGCAGFGGLGHQTWYLGSNEVPLLYNKHAPGSFVDDGLFVAIPDGGPYGGYSYFEIYHPRRGFRDGGPAFLHPRPGELPKDGCYKIASSPHASCHSGEVQPVPGAIKFPGTKIPEFPNGTRIPTGARFFFWVSGGGKFQIGAYFIQEVPNKRVTVRSQAIPKPECTIWFEPSVFSEKTFRLIAE